MAGPKQYQDDKRYLVTGAWLNQITRDLATAQIIGGEGIGFRKIPGSGTEIWSTVAPGDTLGPWGLEVLAEGAVKLIPGRLKRTSALDASGLVTIVDLATEWQPQVGEMLVLAVDPDLTTSLELISGWDGWPYPVDTIESEPPGAWFCLRYYYVLWDFLADTSDPSAIALATAEGTIYAECRTPRTDLQFALSECEDAEGHVVPVYEIVSAQGCRAA